MCVHENVCRSGETTESSTRDVTYRCVNTTQTARRRRSGRHNKYEALRTRSEIAKEDGILAERAALTNAGERLSHLRYHHLHVQRSQTLTFGDGRQVTLTLTQHATQSRTRINAGSHTLICEEWVVAINRSSNMQSADYC